jgi:hypothetical protein
MAKLTASGIVFSDSTVLNSKYGIVPQSSVSIFYQSSAPTGWTKSTTNNDKTLRVVSGTTGGTAGGTTAFSSVFPNSLRTVSAPAVPITGTVGNTTLTTPQLPSHTHPNGGSVGLSPGGGDVASGAGWTRTSPATGTNPGGGGSHTHPWSGTASFSTNIDLRVRYIDVIVCTFN